MWGHHVFDFEELVGMMDSWTVGGWKGVKPGNEMRPEAWRNMFEVGWTPSGNVVGQCS